MLLLGCNELDEFRFGHARARCCSSTKLAVAGTAMVEAAAVGLIVTPQSCGRRLIILAPDVLLQQIAQAGAARSLAGAVARHRLGLFVNLLRLDRQSDGAALAIDV